jgi:hypothetical protein
MLFLWTWSTFQYSKTRPLRFGSWACSRLQVKTPILLGLIEGANPNPGVDERVSILGRDRLLSSSPRRDNPHAHRVSYLVGTVDFFLTIKSTEE